MGCPLGLSMNGPVPFQHHVANQSLVDKEFQRSCRQTAREHEGPWPGMFGGVFAATLIFSPRIISLPFLLLALVVVRRRPRAAVREVLRVGLLFPFAPQPGRP